MTSAVLPPKPRDPATVTGRTYGYVRATTAKEVESVEAQAEIIASYCDGIGRRLDDVFADEAPAGGLPLVKRDGGRQLLANLREGDHVVVARADLMFRSFSELTRTLDDWLRRGVTAHLCDLPVGPLDPDSAVTRHVIDLLVLFNASKSRRIGTRCKVVSDRLEAEGRRNTRFAPFGSRWERRGRLSVLVPEPNEEVLCIKAAEMRLDGYSWHQIRRYFAYEWRVRNREGNAFGYTEIRNMAFRGAELLRAAGRLEMDPAPHPA